MIKIFSKKELEHIFANDFQSPVFPILAQKYFSLKEYKKAEKVCEIGLAHDKNNLIGKYILAKTHLINNQSLKAEKLLKGIIDMDQNNFNALLTLIEVQKTLKRSNNSLKKLINRAHNILPKNKTIKRLYRSINVKTKQKKRIKKESIRNINNNINIDHKMATKTMYLLMLQQSKYNIAQKILEIMIENKKNIKFAQIEFKKIKQLSKLGK